MRTPLSRSLVHGAVGVYVGPLLAIGILAMFMLGFAVLAVAIRVLTALTMAAVR
jgi:hypothetical protein